LLVAKHGDDEQLEPFDPPGQQANDVESRLVCPVEVVEEGS